MHIALQFFLNRALQGERFHSRMRAPSPFKLVLGMVRIRHIYADYIAVDVWLPYCMASWPQQFVSASALEAFEQLREEHQQISYKTSR